MLALTLSKEDVFKLPTMHVDYIKIKCFRFVQSGTLN